jgi:hypothetical protein
VFGRGRLAAGRVDVIGWRLDAAIEFVRARDV